MNRRHYCSRCAKRLPTSSERCVACGGPPQAKPVRSGRARAAGAMIFALVAVLAIGLSDRYLPSVADWYSSMVIRFVPQPALRFAPVDDDLQAFYVCAKSVVKQVEDQNSVVTFATASGNVTVPLGDDLYRVDSFFDEARVDGSTLRRPFTCTVRLDGGSWKLEEVELQAPPTAVAAGEVA